MTEDEEEDESPFMKFFDIKLKRIETSGEFKARQMLWEWMGKCLFGKVW